MKLNLNFKSSSALQSSIVFTILTFLKPAINIFLLPLYLRLMPPEEYGIYTILITITTLVASVGGLKISSAIVTFYYDCKTEEEKSQLLDSTISFIIIFNFLFFILLNLIGPYVFPYIFKSEDIVFFPYINLAIATGMFLPIIQAYNSFVKNEKKVLKYASIQLLFIISAIILQIILITKYSLIGALWAKLIANILTTLLILFYLRNIIRFRIKKEVLIKCLKFSISLIPFFFVFWIGRYADRYILERYIDLSEIAIYGLLMTLAGLVTMASEALANSIQPFLFEAYSNTQKNNAKINQLFLFYTLGLIVFSSCLITVVSNIHLIKPNKKYLEIIPYFYFAIIPTLLNAIQYLFFNIFTYAKKSKRLSLISFVTVSFQLVVLFFLIKTHRIYGAIFASFISNLLSLLWYSIESKKYIKMDYDWKRILPAPIIFLICVLVCVLLRENNVFNYKILGLLFPLFVSIPLMFIYKKELLKLVLKKNG